MSPGALSAIGSAIAYGQAESYDKTGGGLAKPMGATSVTVLLYRGPNGITPGTYPIQLPRTFTDGFSPTTATPSPPSTELEAAAYFAGQRDYASTLVPGYARAGFVAAGSMPPLAV